MSDKLTAALFRVTVSGVPGTFNTFSGGAMERETTNSWNGGSPQYDILAGPPTYANIEVGRPYRHADESWLPSWRGNRGVKRATVTVQKLDENYITVGKPRVYKDCVLAGVTDPEVEAGAASEAMLSLSFATSGPAQ